MMKSINRSVAPAVSLPQAVRLPEVRSYILDNGLRVFLLDAGDQEVVKIDFAFKAGKWFETKNLVAEITNRMLREGVVGKSAFEIASQFEFYGCNLETSISYTHSNIQLYSLAKHLNTALPLLFELFTAASFPQDELQKLITNRKQKLEERLAKTEFVANRTFVSAVWGPQHPYGRLTTREDLDALTREDLEAFYKTYYQPSRAFVIISGRITAEAEQLFRQIFGQSQWEKSPIEQLPKEPVFFLAPAAQRNFYLPKANAVQSSVQCGMATINKYHPDYDALSILNTLFGGYFSSRLMANIREDKGFTYGIYSALSSFQHGGQFEITADVGVEVAAQTMEEISREIERLHSSLVPDDELQTVKNYMAGKILRSIDGPMKYSEVLRGLIQYQRDGDYLNRYLQLIHAITPQRIQELAQQYLRWNEMVQVRVG
ncbi:MAG: pitrilysin family protein [Chitinophagales bacterium]